MYSVFSKLQVFYPQTYFKGVAIYADAWLKTAVNESILADKPLYSSLFGLHPLRSFLKQQVFYLKV